MRAARYRLRFTPGVSVDAAAYGSSTFGGPITYGQRASDPVLSPRYRIVPLPAGSPTGPAWIYRQGDIYPALQALVLGGSLPLDLVSTSAAYVVLTPQHTGGPSFVYPLDVVTPTAQGLLQHAWQPDDLDVPADSYRTTFVLYMQSGRRLTLPTDDALVLVVNPVHTLVP